MENKDGPSRKAQLEAYDGLARLRPIWDHIASEYDVVIALAANDEAILREGHPVVEDGKIVGSMDSHYHADADISIEP